MKAGRSSVRASRWLVSFWLAGFASAALAADAFPVPAEQKDVKKSSRAKPVPATPSVLRQVEPVKGLQGRDVYQILLGEIAFKRGAMDIAVQAYADAAQRTEDAALYERSVQIAIAAQQYANALEISQRWVKAYPDSAAARHVLVSVLAGTGRSAEMVPHIERMLALDVAARPRNLLHLPRLFSGSDPEASLPALQRLVEPYKELPEAQFAIASLARAAGQKELSLAAVREASRLRPGWPVAAYLEAQLQNTPQEAIEVWTRFLKDTKTDEQGYLQRARLYVGEKKYAEGRADFEAALAVNPDSVDTLYALAILALQLNDRPAAEQYFQRLDGQEFAGKGLVDYQLGVLAQERNDEPAAQRHFDAIGKGDYYVMARAQLALIMSRQGKTAEARQLLADTEATTAIDRSRLAIAESQLLREVKQFEAALAVLEKALTAEPNEPDLLYDKAMLAERLKKVDVVESTLARLIELRPNHPHAYNALGYSWAERNVRLDEARQLIARALELAPQDPFILDSMGWVMFRLGQPKVALVHLEDAYRQRPDPEIAAHLGEVLWALDRHEDARKIWADARQRFPDNDVLGAVIDRFKP